MEWQLNLKEVGRKECTCRTYLAMALYGGLRAEEIANIRRGSFVADQDLIGFVGKDGKQRSVALPPRALKFITEYLTSNGAVPRASDPLIRKQNGSGGALSYYVINHVVTRWTKHHLGARLTPHKLHHAYGRQCVDLGMDIRMIAEALGHESLESTKIYTQASFQRTRRIAESIRCTTPREIRCVTRAGTSRNS